MECEFAGNGADQIARSSCSKLTYGNFYGAFKRRYELSRFSIALIDSDELAISGIKHFHEAAHIIFVLRGQYVSSLGGNELIAPFRSLVFVPEGTTHKDRFQTTETKTLSISISSPQLELANNCVRMPEIQSTFRGSHERFLANRLVTECLGWSDTSPLITEGLCLELLASVARCDKIKDTKPPTWVLIARELLHDRCRESIRLSEIASTAGVHPIHLTRTFRRFFNCTPGEYLRNCRLDLVSSLLKSNSMSIGQAALEAGFTDQSHMCKTFKRKFGITPAEFRNQS